jgi:hypothetical protein
MRSGNDIGHALDIMAAVSKRKFSVSAALTALAMAFLITVGPGPARPQAVELVVVDVATVAKGYRASKLIGTNIRNDKNEQIGELEDIIIGQDQALFAVIQVGGFLGVGGRLAAVPFQSLVLEDGGRRIVLPGATKDTITKLPEFKYGS